MDGKKGSDQTGYWTNEKHMNYLNSMEASFVRAVFGSDDSLLLRLDRHLPDSSDSTLDVKNCERRRRHSTSAIVDRRAMADDKRVRRPLPPEQKEMSSQDQVVPQLESKAGDKDEKGPTHRCSLH